MLYAKRKSETDSLYNSDQFAKLLPLAERDEKWLKTNGIHDSVYQCNMKIVRSLWKLKGKEVASKRAEEILTYVIRFDSDTAHHLSTLSDLSWFYYEIGNDSLLLYTDQRYIDVCNQFSDATTIERVNGYYNLGYDFLAMGNSNKAMELWKTCISILEADAYDKEEQFTTVYNALGSAYYRTGDFLNARKYYLNSLKYSLKHPDPYVSNSNAANSYGNLCLISNDEGNYIEAKEFLESCVEYRRMAIEKTDEPQLKYQEQEHLIKSYHHLASIYLGIGEYSRCLKYLQLTKDEKSKLLDDSDSRNNIIFDGFARYYLAVGDYQMARQNAETYRKLCEDDFGHTNFWTGMSINMLANVDQEMHNYEGAIRHYSDAIGLFKVIEDEEKGKELSFAYFGRAECNSALGNYLAALQDLESAMAIYGETRSAGDPVLGQCYLLKAEIQLKVEDIEGAKVSIQNVVGGAELYQAQNQNKHSRLAFFNPNLPEAYYLSARIQESIDSSEASLKIAFGEMGKAAELLRLAKNVYDADDAQLMHYQSHEHIFSYAQELSHRLFKSTNDPAYFNAFFQLAEENKTVMLRRQLSSFNSVEFANIPDSLVIIENELQRSLRDNEFLLHEPDWLLKQEKKYDDLIEEIQLNHPQYYQLKYNESVADILSIQKKVLKEGVNLLEYVVTNDKIFAVVVTKSDHHVLELQKEGLAELILDYNRAITNHLKVEVAQRSFQLYEQLFKPVSKYFDGNEILIVPDNELFSINFETLRKSVDGGASTYVIHDYVISYLLSATTALQFNRLNSGKKEGVLALAPGFSDELKRDYLAQKEAYSFFDESFMQLIQQPFAVKSANSIASLLNGKALTNKNATEENFRESASKYGILHFGTHTEINNISPLMSRLILSSAGSDSLALNDGYLHAYEIYNMQLRAELAVLSACETGIGQQNNSEGFFSLAHSFAYAGCPSVVMSAWKIDEKTSAEIIEKFYAYLADGLPKNQALRLAKIDFMNQHPGELDEPYYWAGMILMGDTAPLQATSSSHFWWIWGLFGLTLLVVILYLRKRSRRRK